VLWGLDSGVIVLEQCRQHNVEQPFAKNKTLPEVADTSEGIKSFKVLFDQNMHWNNEVVDFIFCTQTKMLWGGVGREEPPLLSLFD
jgi:hypothetical protein